MTVSAIDKILSSIEDEHLSHEDVPTIDSPTIQQVYDSMSPAQQDAVDMVCGAIATEDESVGGDTLVTEDQTITDIFNTLSEEQLAVAIFLAGAIEPSMAHSEMFDTYLEHHGVKGQRWGVRNDGGSGASLSKSAANTSEGRKAARAAVKGGSATLGEAHLAALKSTGHRATNALLGDKKFWKTTGIILGAGLTGAVAATVAPAVLPAGALTALGAHSISAGIVSAPHIAVGGTTVMLKASALAAGKTMATAIGLTATSIGTGVAGTVSSVTNLGRAAFGNSRINKSYQKLGEGIALHQTQGTKRINDILKKNGSINLKHQESDMDALTKVLTAIVAKSEDDLEQHGVKGMRWGVRRTDAQLSGAKGADGSSGKEDQSALDKMKSKLGIGGSGGSGKDTGLSADAERVLRTSQKDQHEASTQELKAAVARKRAVDEYNALFAPDANAQLKAKVDALRLQQDYARMQREMNPTKLQRVSNFINSAESAYSSFKKLDNATNNVLSKNINKEFSDLFKAANAAPKPPKTKSPSSGFFGKKKKSTVPPSPIHLTPNIPKGVPFRIVPPSQRNP